MIDPAWEPRCMDAEELARWRDADAAVRDRASGHPCADCLPAFRAEMSAAGR